MPDIKNLCPSDYPYPQLRETPSGDGRAMPCSPSSDVKRMGAVTISRNGYVEKLEEKNQRLMSALQKIASGLYDWQQCVDVIAPEAIADFHSENADVMAPAGERTPTKKTNV